MSEQRICIGPRGYSIYSASETVSHSLQEIIMQAKLCEEIMEDIRKNRLHKLREEAVAEIIRLFSSHPYRFYTVGFAGDLPSNENECYAECFGAKVIYCLERHYYQESVIVESTITKVFLDDSGIITIRTTRNDDVHLAVVENPENVLYFLLRAKPFEGILPTAKSIIE